MSRPHIPTELDRQIRVAAQNRCGYCLSPQRLVMARLEIEHIIPLSKGGGTTADNLWLACPLCNRYKSDLTQASDPMTGQIVALFNPRQQNWFEHFGWSRDGLRVVGLTASGRATVAVLHLDDDSDAIIVRSYWVLAGWHPPQE